LLETTIAFIDPDPQPNRTTTTLTTDRAISRSPIPSHHDHACLPPPTFRSWTLSDRWLWRFGAQQRALSNTRKERKESAPKAGSLERSAQAHGSRLLAAPPFATGLAVRRPSLFPSPRGSDRPVQATNITVQARPGVPESGLKLGACCVYAGDCDCRCCTAELPLLLQAALPLGQLGNFTVYLWTRSAAHSDRATPHR
jgi:hypothetical protein